MSFDDWHGNRQHWYKLSFPDTPTTIEYGSNSYNGRVAFNPQGSWQYIRADSFDDADAKVICRRLGYDTDKYVIIVLVYVN